MIDESTDKEEYEGLPLRLAYSFLADKGIEKESNEIRQSKDKYKSYTSTLKRGKVIDLLENNDLLDEFTNKHWSFGGTESGKRKIQRYKRILESFLNNDRSEEEEEAESIDETSFAYEADLRDYLSNNLNIIEAGLTLFKDKNGIEGLEYSIDDNNKRIDILAIDSNKTPVVIELKVSRGYEKVIGQCLYYKNKVKERLGTTKARIIIIAREITPHLKIATAELPDVELYEYKLAVKLRKL
ncbi:MAG TPA: endonuclease NucS [Smithellaceae bacterium]|jgi:hypothetical protein|nr:endonuclease NucS [Smithellaceae bacterium]HPW22757.1 endonuclease NucS [Smithellaceae bacterium]